MKITARHIVEADEEKIVVKLKSLKGRLLIFHIFEWALLLFPGGFFAVIGFLTNQTLICAFSCFSLGYICLYIEFFIKFWRERSNRFCFSLTPNGIYLSDIDGTFEIEWKSVASFGIVNHNLVNGGKGSFYQSCMYFSLEKRDEDFLRKKMLKRQRDTGSDKEMIIFPFCIDNAEEEYKAFCEYIYRYCDKEKEQNFIEIVV